MMDRSGIITGNSITDLFRPSELWTWQQSEKHSTITHQMCSLEVAQISFSFFFLHRPIVVRQDSDDGEALGGGVYQLLKGVKTAVQ